MARRVAPFYAEGLLCPRCGRPLTWLGEWRGPRFVRKPITTTIDQRASLADEPVRVVTQTNGVEAKVQTRWRHEVSLICTPPCTWAGGEDQARRGSPRPEDVPKDYYLAGDEPPLPGLAPSANGVQTRRAARGRQK